METKTMIKILLLEDDQILSETLAQFLTRAGYKIDMALTMEEAEDLSYQHSYDLYLFDINLPKGSGLALLTNLRHAEDTTPTIFITALSDMHFIEEGFRLGAIDYIKKPFNPKELLIRIGAKFKTGILTYGHITFDPKAEILRKDGKIIDMGDTQYKVFTTLLRHKGSMVKKEILYECLERVSDTALRVAITKIKQRLEIDIINIRGKGYVIEKL